MDWDPSRDYDSQTFSDDYNLHGASARSFDHPSVTRDNDFFNQEDLNDDHYSIENADLIADIVDGKITQDHRARISRGGHRTGDNSGPKPFVPRSGLRPPAVRSVPAALPPPEPAVEKPADPKPVFRSALKPPNNIKSKLGRHIQLPKEIFDDDDTDDMAAVTQQEPMETTTKSSPQVIQQEEPKLEEIELVDDPLVQPTPVPGPSRFTRIIKKTASPNKKLVATIPMPLDDHVVTKDDEDNKRVQQSVKDLRIMLGRLGLLPLSVTLDASLDSLTASDVEKGGLCEMMGLLTRLGGMYEKQKEVIHQMTDQLIAGETGQGSNREMEKKLQGSTLKLETAQTQIREAVDRNRVLESQLETQSNDIEELRNENEELKKESEDLRNEIETMSSEIGDLKNESEELRNESEDLRNEIETMSSEIGNLRSENEELRSESEELRTESEGLRDEIEALLAKASEAAQENKEDDREANWSAVEEHLQRKEARALKRTTAGQLSTVSAHDQGDWKNHIQMIEKELDALKSMLSRNPSSLPRDDVEERLNDALLENRRLQNKNKSLTKELLSLHEEGSAQEDKGKTVQKLKALLREITVCLGVDNHQQIVPALTDIQMNMEELSSIRKFIAKTERIIWESEIADGSVKVQSPGSSIQENSSNGTPTNETKKDYSSMRPGKTCSQNHESTLQRLREWSELLDVLNHVEFGDDVDDNSSTATVKHTKQ
ncbi:hypothetical protein BGZ82_004901 [Podila clonocystis]|nr:hypothetical protein BGZ82_004901 [Podila clonocystis]